MGSGSCGKLIGIPKNPLISTVFGVGFWVRFRVLVRGMSTVGRRGMLSSVFELYAMRAVQFWYSLLPDS